MRLRLFAAVTLIPLLAGGCVARTAVGIATAPVKVVSKTVDWTTTSQDEADRNAGRKARKERKRAEQECRRNGGTDCGRR